MPTLTRLLHVAGIFGYFWLKTAIQFHDCSEGISKRAVVKTYPWQKLQHSAILLFRFFCVKRT